MCFRASLCPMGSCGVGKGGDRETGGEAGIRTLDTAFRPYNGLANRRLQPLGHLTATRPQVYARLRVAGTPLSPKLSVTIVPADATAVSAKFLSSVPIHVVVAQGRSIAGGGARLESREC